MKLASRLLLPVLFLLVAGQLGVFLALAVPPGEVADEHNHVMRADSLLHGEVLAHRALSPVPDGVWRLQQDADSDPALMLVAEQPALHPITGQRWAQVDAQRWTGSMFVPLGTIASYWPVFYVPAAAALGVAKAAGIRPFAAFHLARLANLATFLALGLAALLLARRGQALLFCTLSLPMTLSLAASVNQDGLIIAASALAAALLTWPCGTPRLLAAMLLGSVAMAKPPYLPLAGVLLLPFPPWRQRRAWLERCGLILLVGLAALSWAALALHDVATPVLRVPAEAGPLWPGPRPAIFAGTDIRAQLGVLLARPARLVTLPWRSLWHDPDLGRQAIGILGWLNVRLPPWLYGLWAWALAAAAVADAVGRRAGAVVLPARQAAWPLLCLVAALLGVYLSQYLSWTAVGGAFIDGVQGRYLLPLLPILALALPSLRPLPALHAALAALPAAACLAGAAVLPGIVIGAYYLR